MCSPAGEFDALKEVLGDAGGQRDVVSGLLSRISTLQAAVASAEATRRKMHNELVSIRGNVGWLECCWSTAADGHAAASAVPCTGGLRPRTPPCYLGDSSTASALSTCSRLCQVMQPADKWGVVHKGLSIMRAR